MTPRICTVSRRDLLSRTGGALLALGSATLLSGLPRIALGAATGYVATRLGFELDGVDVGALQSADGGDPRRDASGIPEPMPLTIVPGPVMKRAFYDWVQSAPAWVGTIAGTPRSAALVAYDSSYQAFYRLDLQDVLIRSIELPDLQAGSPEPARLQLGVFAGSSAHQYGTKPGVLAATVAAASLPPVRGSFRLYIQGLESATLQARRIEPLAARTPGIIDPSTSGGTTRPRIEAWSCLPLKFEVPFNACGPFYKWLNDGLTQGAALPGVLQLLSSDLRKIVANVDLTAMRISRVTGPLSGTVDQLPVAMVECSCRELKFSFAA